VKAVIQRVAGAGIKVDQEEIAGIGCGLLVLLGVGKDDTEEDAEYIAEKIACLRIFDDAAGKLNLSVKDVGGSVLLVSQFTLYGDCRKGRRPSFTDAADTGKAEALYLRVADELRHRGLPVQTGRFRAAMKVSLVNDGPVTILLESPKNL
jgi:D-tyrosyl-tRNA(Tyr) deacylase